MRVLVLLHYLYGAQFEVAVLMVYLRLTTQFPMLGEIKVPLQILPSIPVAGLLIGVIGALIAIGRIRF